jgi:DNA polymerase-3 subunit epsilon
MKVFWFDCETSGTDAAKHGIISLAYTVEIDGQSVAEGELFSNCDRKEIEDSALAVNGFTRERIAGAPMPSVMKRNLELLFGRHVDKFDRTDKFYAGGYNADFDMRFLRQLWKDCGDDYFGSWFYFSAVDPAAVIPFMRYAGMLEGYPSSSKLSDVASYFGIANDQAHEARADIKTTIAISQKIIQITRGHTV